MIKKVLLSTMILSFVNLQLCTFAAPVIRLNENGVFEVYDDEVVYTQQEGENQESNEVVIITNTSQEVQKQKEPSQTVENKVDYAQQDQSRLEENKQSVKEPQNKKSVGSKISDGIVTGLLTVGAITALVFTCWLNSDDDEEDDDDKEEYCSKCNKYHKKHDDVTNHKKHD